MSQELTYIAQNHKILSSNRRFEKRIQALTARQPGKIIPLINKVFFALILESALISVYNQDRNFFIRGKYARGFFLGRSTCKVSYPLEINQLETTPRGHL